MQRLLLLVVHVHGGGEFAAGVLKGLIEVGLLRIGMKLLLWNAHEVTEGGGDGSITGEEELVQLGQLLLHSEEGTGNGVQFDLLLIDRKKANLQQRGGIVLVDHVIRTQQSHDNGLVEGRLCNFLRNRD